MMARFFKTLLLSSFCYVVLAPVAPIDSALGTWQKTSATKSDRHPARQERLARLAWAERLNEHGTKMFTRYSDVIYIVYKVSDYERLNQYNLDVKKLVKELRKLVDSEGRIKDAKAYEALQQELRDKHGMAKDVKNPNVIAYMIPKEGGTTLTVYDFHNDFKYANFVKKMRNLENNLIQYEKDTYKTLKFDKEMRQLKSEIMAYLDSKGFQLGQKIDRTQVLKEIDILYNYYGQTFKIYRPEAETKFVKKASPIKQWIDETLQKVKNFGSSIVNKIFGN